MEDKIVQILVQGGLAGVAVLSLWINYKIVSNHINHATDAMTKMTEAIGKLNQLISDKIK